MSQVHVMEEYPSLTDRSEVACPECGFNYAHFEGPPDFVRRGDDHRHVSDPYRD